MTYSYNTIAETKEFLDRAKSLNLSKAVRNDIINSLAKDPEKGVPLGGGIFKVKIGRDGGGKSGGYRVLYFFKPENMPLYLLTIFGKNEKDNITKTQLAQLISIGKLLVKAHRKTK